MRPRRGQYVDGIGVRCAVVETDRGWTTSTPFWTLTTTSLSRARSRSLRRCAVRSPASTPELMGPHPAVAAVRLASGVRSTGSTAPVPSACSGAHRPPLALAAATAFEAPRAGYVAGAASPYHGCSPVRPPRRACGRRSVYELGFDPVEVVVVTVGGRRGPGGPARTSALRRPRPPRPTHCRRRSSSGTPRRPGRDRVARPGRGSGPRSIAGMRRQHGRWLRPLLGCGAVTPRPGVPRWGSSRGRTPHNADPSFQRVRCARRCCHSSRRCCRAEVAQSLARTRRSFREDLDA